MRILPPRCEMCGDLVPENDGRRFVISDMKIGITTMKVHFEFDVCKTCFDKIEFANENRPVTRRTVRPKARKVHP